MSPKEIFDREFIYTKLLNTDPIQIRIHNTAFLWLNCFNSKEITILLFALKTYRYRIKYSTTGYTSNFMKLSRYGTTLKVFWKASLQNTI